MIVSHYTLWTASPSCYTVRNVMLTNIILNNKYHYFTRDNCDLLIHVAKYDVMKCVLYKFNNLHLFTCRQRISSSVVRVRAIEQVIKIVRNAV